MADRIIILGAGLVGSLLGVLLRGRGYEVDIYERRPDMRRESISAGRSINMAMSARGWKALELAGLRQPLESITIPMYGRQLHQSDGSMDFQAYGRNGEAIYSISRGELNKQLMTEAEKRGVRIHFQKKCLSVALETNRVDLADEHGQKFSVNADLVFGADGASSALRASYVQHRKWKVEESPLNHGYKELCIPPGPGNRPRMEQNALHIWPRRNFMMIALPNPDHNFTCTLFLPYHGDPSFDQLQSEEDLMTFFQKEFPDAVPMMPTLREDFARNPLSSLTTIYTHTWNYKGKSALIGDAAHAIVPFYGQGMNAGFEDCTVLMDLLDRHGNDWETILTTYHEWRKPNGDAVAELALLNFVEMRDRVADPEFLERKKIEKQLGLLFPDQFVSVYEMVSFTHIPYTEALKSIRGQDRLLEKIKESGDFFSQIENPEYRNQLKTWVDEYARYMKEGEARA